VRALAPVKALRPAVLGLLVLASPAFAPGAERDTPPSPNRAHQVTRGDTLGAIAKRYGVTVAAIVTANGLPSAGTVLKLGQRLVIPGAAALMPVRVPPPRPARPKTPGGIVLAVPDFADASPPFAWPAEGPVTSAYGRRPSGWHRGIDIKAERGTPIQAAAAGVVVASRVEPRYGLVIKIAHEQGFVTVYAHNDQNLVEVADRVAAGETIATTGRTGRATTYHVHFEIQRDGQHYNPLYLLPLPPRIAQVDETDENPPDD